MTLEQALGTPGALVAAWDILPRVDESLGVYRVGPVGARLLAREQVPAARRAALTEDLRARGVRVGATCGADPHVWVADDRGFDAWDDVAHVVDATRGALRVRGRLVLARAIVRVVSFLDPDDTGHRGVRLDRAGADAVLVAEEHDPAAALDPTYDVDNLMIDGAWATFLGRDLAAWLGVPHDDELP